MSQNTVIVSLFYKYGYAVMGDAPDTSHLNSPAEGPHGYIGKPVRYLIEGYQVPLKIWPYALSNYIYVHGMIPHGKS